MTNKIFPSVFNVFAALACLAGICGCSDFFEPVESTPTPTEYAYNYWLLARTYLYEDELKNLSPEGDSVQELYSKLSDKYTRYVPPSKSEATITAINTSFVSGDIGLEYQYGPRQDYPLCIKRVYPEGPAGDANVPRYGCIKSINGNDLGLSQDKSISDIYNSYKSVLNQVKEVKLEVYPWSDSDSIQTFEMTKEDIYAPTVFVDTVEDVIVITISAFKQTTTKKNNRDKFGELGRGSYGELAAYLDSTRDLNVPRLIDLRGNPGGHVTHCIHMADLFIESGVVSSRHWRSFDGNGEPVSKDLANMAVKGDPGEGKDYVLLVNGSSASCAEIFTAALSEGAGIPVVGQTTYGKGIGQSSWNTIDGGVAMITNLEFLTPKGNSYHKKGIVPEEECDPSQMLSCGIDFLKKKYGTKTATKKKPGASFTQYPAIEQRSDTFGGAFIENQDPVLDIFQAR